MLLHHALTVCLHSILSSEAHPETFAQSRTTVLCAPQAFAGASIGLPALPRRSPSTPGPPPPQEDLAAEAFEELADYHDQVASCLPGGVDSPSMHTPTVTYPADNFKMTGTPRFSGMPPPLPPPPGVLGGAMSLPVSPFARTAGAADGFSPPHRATQQHRSWGPSAVDPTSTGSSVAGWAVHPSRFGVQSAMPVFLTGSPYPGLEDTMTSARSTLRTGGGDGSTAGIGKGRERPPGSWDAMHNNPLAAPERASTQPSSPLRSFLRGPGGVAEGREWSEELRQPGALSDGGRGGDEEHELRQGSGYSAHLSDHVQGSGAGAGCIGGLCTDDGTPSGRPLAEAVEANAALAARPELEVLPQVSSTCCPALLVLSVAVMVHLLTH